MSNKTLEIMDRQFFASVNLAAKPMTDKIRLKNRKLLSLSPLPPRVDYSPYVTMVYDQLGGGCGHCATLAVVNIMKEMECKYSPDLSRSFLYYLANESNFLQRDSRIELGLDGGNLMERYGCCSETTWPSIGSDWPDNNPPVDRAFAEAKNYRIKLIHPNSDALGVWETISNPDLEQIKLWLNEGPIIGSGNLHAKAIIGYDDDKGTLNFLNSYGDQYGFNRNGMQEIPYDRVFTGYPGDFPLDVLKVDEITRFKLQHRLGPQFAGRIRVRHNSGRKFLTVKIWVEGQKPEVVWAFRARGNEIEDRCLNLNFDFPLPNYAKRFWPPNENNKWWVQVSDNTSGQDSGNAGTVDEVVLVERWRMPHLGIIDKSPLVYKPIGTPFTLPYGGTVSISF